MFGAPFQLEPLLAAVRARSTGLGSTVHGDLHWRTVGRDGLWIADAVPGVDRAVVFWDADRLDLPRVGATPRPELFSTAIARDGVAPKQSPPGWQQLAYRI